MSIYYVSAPKVSAGDIAGNRIGLVSALMELKSLVRTMQVVSCDMSVTEEKKNFEYIELGGQGKAWGSEVQSSPEGGLRLVWV